MSGTLQSTAQKLFKRIVLHNKIVADENVADRLLAREPDPEKLLRALIQQGKLTKDVGEQLLTLYRRQLDKHLAGVRESGAALSGKSTPPDAASDFDSLIADALTGTDESPAAETDSPATEMEAEPAPAEPVAEKTASRSTSSRSAATDDLPLLELDTDDDVPEPVSPSPAAVARQASPSPAAVAPSSAAPRVSRNPAPSAVPSAAPAVSPARPPLGGPAPKSAPSYSPAIVRILEAARAVNASDVHIKSGEIPLLRVAGTLRDLENHPRMSAADVEAGLLTLLSSEQRERFLSTNDLDFCLDTGESLGRFRTNYMRQHRGMDGIFRLISSKVPSFEELKLPPMVRKFTDYKQGIVLVTGPKGCGKTTTLAAMVDLINSSRAEHIITVEDPIEFVHPCKKGHVNQREVGAHTEKFSNALRAALREAPDVIMVGEMRDLETTSLAITAAETGHLVFATLHTPDAIRTIDRVLDVFPPKEQGQIRSMVSESMRGIISQLLLPSVDGKSQELAVEILVNTTAIGNLIREEKTFQLRGIMQTGRRLGMQLMDDSLLELAKAGRINKDEAIALSAEPANVRKQLGMG